MALCCSTGAVLAAEAKPSLSAEIEKVLVAQGIVAAKARFAAIYPAHKDVWELDLDALMKLGTDRIQAGDMDTGMAVLEMATRMQLDRVTTAIGGTSPARAKAEQAMRAGEAQAAAQQADAPAAAPAAAAAPATAGPARDDLERFTGLYGDAADGGRRNLFVTVSCDGFLVAGPSWADMSPWRMRSASERVFTYADSFTRLRLEFAVGKDGRGRAVTHDLAALASPLRRVGPLPGDWSACVERPRR